MKNLIVVLIASGLLTGCNKPESQFACHMAQAKYHSSWGMVSTLELYALKADMDRECK